MDGRKRKQNAKAGGGRGTKKSKRGNDGRWKTSHHSLNLAHRVELGRSIEAGDAGFWVTCPRGREAKATSELLQLCDKLGERLYGIKPPASLEEEATLARQEESDDIESSVQAEIDQLSKHAEKSTLHRKFVPVRSNMDCVFFIKTRDPVDPVDFCLKLCQEAESPESIFRGPLRHVNRLSPVSCIGTCLDKGLEKVARETLGSVFELQPEESQQEGLQDGAGKGSRDGSSDALKACSYGIRTTIRAGQVGRDEVIKRVAAVVHPTHKVNLTSPDKVVLVEIFKSFCGLSVVDGKEYERLKRYNLYEIYQLSHKKEPRPDGAPPGKQTADNEPRDGGVTTAEKSDE